MIKLRIGIVNDIKLAQEVLKRFVNSVPEFEVAWVAANGREAIDMAVKNPPDLILMDLIMPVMNGVEATREIMIKSPCPILIVTANPVDNSSMIFEAMGYGALDVVMTPTIGVAHEPVAEQNLRNKIDVIAKLTGKANTSPGKDQKNGVLQKPLSEPKIPPLVILGSSTGGPFALSRILSEFSDNCPYAFVVIQHVDEVFSSGFAAWLASQIKLPVKIAENGDMIQAGCVLVAGKNDHLVLTGGLFLKYTPVPEEIPYRPSVDVFFQSVARYWPTSGVAVLLTGMGSDGALGMKVLSNVGWHTIAEHQSSCVVYGMPKAAIEMGAAKQVLVLEKIASEINENMKKERRI